MLRIRTVGESFFGSVCVEWQAPNQSLGRLKRRVPNKSEARVSISLFSPAPKLSLLGNWSVNQEREMYRGIDICKCVEKGGSLQLIKVLCDKLLPSLVKDLGGAGLHASAHEPAPGHGRSKVLTWKPQR